MNSLLALARWTLRAWPAIAVIPIAVLHYFALHEYAHSSSLVNKLVGMTLQIAGGLIVVTTINQNLGLFRNQSTLEALKLWLRQFPLRAPSEVTHRSTGAVMHVRIGVSGGGGPLPETLEQRIAQLELAIADVRSDLQNGFARVQNQLDDAKAEVGVRIDTTAGKVAGLSSRVERAAVGSFKMQAFGVILAIYGAVTSVYA